MRANTATRIIICSITHVSEHEIFRRGTCIASNMIDGIGIMEFQLEAQVRGRTMIIKPETQQLRTKKVQTLLFMMVM